MTGYNILMLICPKQYETIVQHDTSKYHDANVYQTLWSLCSTMLPPNFLTTVMYTKHYICNVLHDTFQYKYIPNIMNLIFYMTPYNILWRGNWLIFLFVEKLCSNIIMPVCTCSYYERPTIYSTIFMSGLQCPVCDHVLYLLRYLYWYLKRRNFNEILM